MSENKQLRISIPLFTELSTFPIVFKAIQMIPFKGCSNSVRLLNVNKSSHIKGDLMALTTVISSSYN